MDGLTQADGATLQEAAEALRCRLLVLALTYRSQGFTADRAHFGWAGFLHELGEIAANGGDIRARVF